MTMTTTLATSVVLTFLNAVATINELRIDPGRKTTILIMTLNLSCRNVVRAVIRADKGEMIRRMTTIFGDRREGLSR